MLVKQQDRLEEREQDIEEQLYKLESDKRLVEVILIYIKLKPRRILFIYQESAFDRGISSGGLVFGISTK